MWLPGMRGEAGGGIGVIVLFNPQGSYGVRRMKHVGIESERVSVT